MIGLQLNPAQASIPVMTENLFDKSLLHRRRIRAAAKARKHDFLLRRACDDIAVRLDGILREFPVVLSLGEYDGVMSTMLAQRENIGHVISAGRCPHLFSGPCRIACDEEQLPFSDHALDMAVSALSLHFANDLPGALIQIRRALKPDGVFLGAVLGGDTLVELREVLTVAESEIEGGASPRVIPFADVRDYGGLLQRAGFSLPVTDADIFTVTYLSMFELMHDIRGMGASNMLTARSRKPLRRDTLFRAAELYAQRYPADGGRIRATFEIIHMSGWSPHENQPQPLRPGSATNRLADALGTREQAAGEKAMPLSKTKDVSG
jgi:SAM-dependent methyltransferase